MEANVALVIEDSVAVCIRLKEFLQKLGFSKIHIAKTGKDGIDIFKECVSSEITPLVFLDYNLPDMEGLSVIEQILDIRPETKVILETSREKNDEKVKQVISYGAYSYLPKPFGLEEVQQIVGKIKSEHDALRNFDNTMDIIHSFLKNNSKVSLAMITDSLGKTKSEVTQILQTFEKNGQIVESGTAKEVCCDKCGTIKVQQFFHCPSCYSINFKKDKVIEHYSCGNTSPARTYKNDKCPNCSVEIKVLGVDYKSIDNFYICNDCGDKFPELEWNFKCLSCNNKFDINSANWRESPNYKVISV